MLSPDPPDREGRAVVERQAVKSLPSLVLAALAASGCGGCPRGGMSGEERYECLVMPVPTGWKKTTSPTHSFDLVLEDPEPWYLGQLVLHDKFTVNAGTVSQPTLDDFANFLEGQMKRHFFGFTPTVSIDGGPSTKVGDFTEVKRRETKIGEVRAIEFSGNSNLDVGGQAMEMTGRSLIAKYEGKTYVIGTKHYLGRHILVEKKADDFIAGLRFECPKAK
jgi:hypothetical protein